MTDPSRAHDPAQFRSLFRSLVLDPTLLLDRVLTADSVARAVVELAGKSCGRIFTPLATLAVFLGQVLADDRSCRAAVARLLAWRAARGLRPGSPDTGAYCKARLRLPEALLPRLVRETGDSLQCRAPDAWLCRGRRVVIVDGSCVSMPDTPGNQAAFPQHKNQKPGCGFPIARILVLLSLATGGVLDAALGGSKGKLSGEHALLRSLHGRCGPATSSWPTPTTARSTRWSRWWGWASTW